MSITDDIERVRERVRVAARREGRSADEIEVMAVRKTVPPERIRDAYDVGLRLFGENRVQEFAGKAAPLSSLPGAAWHMIGHLQTNKAAKAAELFHAVDSLDSIKLADKLDAVARNIVKKLDILIEVNVGGEAAKSGLAPDSRELEDLLLTFPRL